MNKHKEQVDEFREEAIYDYADKFINLANEMCKSDNSGTVGLGLRYAAARYSAYEATLRTNNLIEDKDNQLEYFTNVFNKMLKKNIDEYGKRQLQNKIH